MTIDIVCRCRRTNVSKSLLIATADESTMLQKANSRKPKLPVTMGKQKIELLCTYILVHDGTCKFYINMYIGRRFMCCTCTCTAHMYGTCTITCICACMLNNLSSNLIEIVTIRRLIFPMNGTLQFDFKILLYESNIH